MTPSAPSAPSPPRRCALTDLVDDAWVSVAVFLQPFELEALARTSRHFRGVAGSNGVWEWLLERDYNRRLHDNRPLCGPDDASLTVLRIVSGPPLEWLRPGGLPAARSGDEFRRVYYRLARVWSPQLTTVGGLATHEEIIRYVAGNISQHIATLSFLVSRPPFRHRPLRQLQMLLQHAAVGDGSKLAWAQRLRMFRTRYAERTLLPVPRVLQQQQGVQAPTMLPPPPPPLSASTSGFSDSDSGEEAVFVPSVTALTCNGRSTVQGLSNAERLWMIRRHWDPQIGFSMSCEVAVNRIKMMVLSLGGIAVALGPGYLAAPRNWLSPVLATVLLTPALCLRNVLALSYEAVQWFLPVPPFLPPVAWTRSALQFFWTGGEAVRWVTAVDENAVAACREFVLGRYTRVCVTPAHQLVASAGLPPSRVAVCVIALGALATSAAAIHHGFVQEKARRETPHLRHIDSAIAPALVTRLADAATEAGFLFIVADLRIASVVWNTASSLVTSVFLLSPLISLGSALLVFYYPYRRSRRALETTVQVAAISLGLHLSRYLPPIARWVLGRVSTTASRHWFELGIQAIGQFLYPNASDLRTAAWIEMGWISGIAMLTMWAWRREQQHPALFARRPAAGAAGRSLTYSVVHPNCDDFVPPPITAAVRSSALLTAAIAAGGFGAIISAQTPAKAAIAYFGLTFGVSMLSYVGKRVYYYYASLGNVRHRMYAKREK